MAQYWQSETKRSENKMDINLSKAQYSEMYKEASKGTKWWVTIPKAFLFGGLICVIGQSLMDMYLYLGLSKDNASMSVSITLIFLSALLTGLLLSSRRRDIFLGLGRRSSLSADLLFFTAL